VLWARTVLEIRDWTLSDVQFKYQYSPQTELELPKKTKKLRKCMKLFKLEFPEGWRSLFHGGGAVYG